MAQIDNIAAIIEAAREGVNPVELVSTAKKTLYFVANGEHGNGQFYEYDREPALAHPLRKRGSTTFFDASSFSKFLRDNKDAGNTVIYIDRNPEKPAIVAVLNSNGVTNGVFKTGWGDFRANIEFRPTPQWKKWKDIDGKLMPQVQFAEFLEDNIEDVAVPSGASMLEIATYLEATRTVNFRSGVRLSSGAIQFQNAESIEAKVGAGQIEVPETFTLGIAPIYGLPSYAVPARFRYRLQDGKLQLGFKLQRVESMMSKIIEDVIEAIMVDDDTPILDGIAPAPLKA